MAFPLQAPYATAAQSRALDRLAMEELGVASALLMENAGRALAHLACQVRRSPTQPVILLCGPGNNGGDGFVASRWLELLGAPHTTLLIGSPQRIPPGDGRNALEVLHRLHCPPVTVLSLEHLRELLPEEPWVGVDCVFGTGLTRPVEGLARECLQALDDLAHVKLAADLPSGIDADTGQVLGFAPRCHLTLSFLTAKRAAEIPGTSRYLGTCLVDPIGVPPSWIITTHGKLGQHPA
ncbi:MAG: NAD(P)H-hydrate epimerase [Planctomycetes bacterium]|nr:NAD(P)H-hydrate epimerase [Planctomycetota bacterium]